MAIRGNLSEASLPDVLQLLAMGNKTGTLTPHRAAVPAARSASRTAASVTHLSYGRNLETEDSVFLMFKWNDGSFSFEPGVRPPAGLALVSVDPQELASRRRAPRR